MEQVTVTPSKYIEFDFMPHQKASSSLELYNATDEQLNYKIKVTQPNTYMIKDPSGVIPPRTPSVIRIELRPTDRIPDEVHKIQVVVTDNSNPPSLNLSKVLTVQFTTKTAELLEQEYVQLKTDYENLTGKSAEVTSEVDNLHLSIDKHLKLRKEKQDDALIKKPSAETFSLRALVLCFVLGLIIGTFSGG